MLLRQLRLLLHVGLRLLFRLRGDSRFGCRSILPRPALATRSCVDEVFNSGVVSRRRRRSRDDVAEDAVEVRGKFMATWIDVDGWGESLYIYGLFYTPFDPVLV